MSSPGTRRRRRYVLMLVCLAGTACQPPAVDVASAPAVTGHDQRTVTFCRDVAPVVFQRCSGCHQPGQAAPFPLLTYRDVAKRISQIVQVVERRLMPPWLPEAGHVAFADDISLSGEQIRLFRAWMKQGCLEGQAADLPPLPEPPPDWRLGEPDLILTMPRPYQLAADGSDVYRSFVLPIPIGTARYVRAFEFRPGNPRVVHHANMSTDSTAASRERDAADPGYGFDGMALEATGLDSMFNGWAPGIRPDPGRPGMAARIEPGDDFVLQLHLTPSGKPELVQAQIGLYFAQQPPTRHPQLVRLGSYAVNIPAGHSRYRLSDSYELPVGAEVLGVNPHAHYLARTIRATATKPDGQTLTLMKIANWDFNWQGSYRFARPVQLPRGTRLEVEFTFDNSDGNPRNPHDPPRRVLYGPRTEDEMADLWLLLLPPAGLREKLAGDVSLKELIRRIDGFTNVIQHHPDPSRRAAAHDALGTIFLAQALADDARHHFSRALVLDSNCLPARFHLACLHARRRQFSQAVSQLRHVLQQHPRHAASYYQLGRIAEAQQAEAAARRHYRAALEIDPELAPARRRLEQLAAQRSP